MELKEKIEHLMRDEEADITVIAAGKNGLPWIQKVWKAGIDEKGRIEIYELLESSQIQKNLVYSIWFQKKSFTAYFFQRWKKFCDCDKTLSGTDRRRGI